MQELYHWSPGLNFGYQFRYSGSYAYPAIRIAPGMGNLGYSEPHARLNLNYGASLYTSCAEIGFTASHLNVKTATTSYIDLTYKRFGLSLETISGLQAEQRLLILWKL